MISLQKLFYSMLCNVQTCIEFYLHFNISSFFSLSSLGCQGLKPVACRLHEALWVFLGTCSPHWDSITNQVGPLNPLAETIPAMQPCFYQLEQGNHSANFGLGACFPPSQICQNLLKDAILLLLSASDQCSGCFIKAWPVAVEWNNC